MVRSPVGFHTAGVAAHNSNIGKRPIFFNNRTKYVFEIDVVMLVQLFQHPYLKQCYKISIIPHPQSSTHGATQINGVYVGVPRHVAPIAPSVVKSPLPARLVKIANGSLRTRQETCWRLRHISPIWCQLCHAMPAQTRRGLNDTSISDGTFIPVSFHGVPGKRCLCRRGPPARCCNLCITICRNRNVGEHRSSYCRFVRDSV